MVDGGGQRSQGCHLCDEITPRPAIESLMPQKELRMRVGNTCRTESIQLTSRNVAGGTGSAAIPGAVNKQRDSWMTNITSRGIADVRINCSMKEPPACPPAVLELHVKAVAKRCLQPTGAPCVPCLARNKQRDRGVRQTRCGTTDHEQPPAAPSN